jgi:glycerophosphoryl diester phosphodiesterase
MREKGRSKRWRTVLVPVVVVVIFVWLMNSSLLVRSEGSRPELLAHRGLGQTFDLEGVEWNTNTAAIIHEPRHPYLENTLEGIGAAIESGADVVEFDVRMTKDGQLAVFHDYLLDYRTDGKGDVSAYTMEELRKLDVGYGYTADGGLTYPFRGRGIGQMVSVDQVLTAFPDMAWLIHIKDGGVEAAKVLETHLLRLDGDWQARIAIYGDEMAVMYFREKYPRVKTLTKKLMIKAFLSYELIGWTGYIPKSFRNLEIHMPLNYARLFWGWPFRFLRRVQKANSRFVLVNGSGGFSSGFDDPEALERIPEDYSGCIWTDRIDVVAPIILSQQEQR